MFIYLWSTTRIIVILLHAKYPSIAGLLSTTIATKYFLTQLPVAMTEEYGYNVIVNYAFKYVFKLQHFIQQ